jgi:DNA invertase Pin-like site-specific DNA recombinase
MNVFSYLRVSGKSQIDGDGPERQQKAIEAFCKAHGLTVAGVFFEKGVSGTVEAMNRPRFAAMLEAVEINSPKPVVAIVVERMDRLARDLIVSELLLMECRKAGLAVYSADGNGLENLAGDDADPMRVFVRQVMAAAAQLDKSMLVKKLAVAKARKKALTGRCGGSWPYGEHPASGAHERRVIEAMKAYRNQGLSLDDVTKQLNLGDLRTRSGGKWHKFSVARILQRTNASVVKKRATDSPKGGLMTPTNGA